LTCGNLKRRRQAEWISNVEGAPSQGVYRNGHLSRKSGSELGKHRPDVPARKRQVKGSIDAKHQ
jgi:hypothetical protein